MAKNAKTQVDPELDRQLRSVTAGSKPIEAVIYLRPTGQGQLTVAADQVDPLVRELLERVRASVGQSVRDYNTFRNLGSFVVSASATFLRELLNQPEVASAMANRSSEQE